MSTLGRGRLEPHCKRYSITLQLLLSPAPTVSLRVIKAQGGQNNVGLRGGGSVPALGDKPSDTPDCKMGMTEAPPPSLKGGMHGSLSRPVGSGLSTSAGKTWRAMMKGRARPPSHVLPPSAPACLLHFVSACLSVLGRFLPLESRLAPQCATVQVPESHVFLLHRLHGQPSQQARGELARSTRVGPRCPPLPGSGCAWLSLTCLNRHLGS